MSNNFESRRLTLDDLTTPRLSLREFTVDDDLDFYELSTDPVVVRYVAYGPWTLEEIHQNIAFYTEQQSASPRLSYLLAITLRPENEFIGWCELDVNSPKHREAEISYTLKRQYWGRGYMTEAVQAILEFGFTTLKLHRIFASCHPDNIGSERVMQKIGMQKEGHLRQHRWSQGGWRDSLLYAVLEHEWQY
jgi:ribosomal-protein-alanine N-acetyltransferase